MGKRQVRHGCYRVHHVAYLIILIGLISWSGLQYSWVWLGIFFDTAVCGSNSEKLSARLGFESKK
jgi:hypothetical protein